MVYSTAITTDDAPVWFKAYVITYNTQMEALKKQLNSHQQELKEQITKLDDNIQLLKINNELLRTCK